MGKYQPQQEDLLVQISWLAEVEVQKPQMSDGKLM